MSDDSARKKKIKKKVKKKAKSTTKKTTKKKSLPGRPFKKGNPGGPGRPKDSYYQRVAKGKVKEEFFIYLAKYWEMNLADANENIIDPKITMGERMFLKWFVNRLKDPTNNDMDMLARMLGVNLEKLEISHIGSEDGPIQIQLISPNNEKGESGVFKNYPARTSETKNSL